LQAAADSATTHEVATQLRPLLRRAQWLPWVAGVVIGAGLYFALNLQPTYCLAIALLTALIGVQIEATWAQRRVQRLEIQLADAIDLIVGALRAGGGLLGALENAAHESRRPLRDLFDEMVGRIRLGDNPQDVFVGLTQRVPLETFQLFASALAVHYEVGGSLAPTLATVGRTIRDRIELSRRIRSMTAQSRASVLGVLAATYFIALIMWANDHERMATFLNSKMGAVLVSGAIALQAVGIVWTSLLSRVRF
jgi:Flp pilus assembly protein TadB